MDHSDYLIVAETDSGHLHTWEFTRCATVKGGNAYSKFSSVRADPAYKIASLYVKLEGHQRTVKE